MSLPPLSSDAPGAPLDSRKLAQRLEDALDPVLSSRRTADPLALVLTELDRADQEFTLHWVGVMARTSGELAYQMASRAPLALRKLGRTTAESWIIHAMDTYDREGLHRGSAALEDIDGFIVEARRASRAAVFPEVRNVLSFFLCGLAGRRLKVEDTAEQPFTDTETVYLPRRIADGVTRASNRLVYKALATHLWAQTRYGTYNCNPAGSLAAYADADRALALFHYLETVRIDAIIARELPGLGREIASLREGYTESPEVACLAAPSATAADSLKLVERLYETFEPPRFPYMGTLRLDVAATVRASRVARERKDLKGELAHMLAEHAGDADTIGQPERVQRFSVNRAHASGGGVDLQLRLDGASVACTPRTHELLESIAQDLSDIPEDYLVPSDAGSDGQPQESLSAGIGAGAAPPQQEDALRYPEWDYKRRHYRKQWCTLRETDVEPGSPDFVDATLARYAPQVSQLRRTFELLRGEDKLLKRQRTGDDIDLDALVAAYADLQSGRELPQEVHVKRHKLGRDIAVMFMVDMSGSTKGWINLAEREALVMLCESLDVLGDRYAIYGFSGVTRNRCEIYRIKRFGERYGDPVRARIAGIRPQDYTRMGVAIRHLTRLLDAEEARVKLLITLSDGKPDDYSDNYRGDYGIEDTRQALIEAHRRGIHPFCITIDREAREYLPRMYGAANYAVIDEVARLPLKVAYVYRRLTC